MNLSPLQPNFGKETTLLTAEKWLSPSPSVRKTPPRKSSLPENISQTSMKSSLPENISQTSMKSSLPENISQTSMKSSPTLQPASSTITETLPPLTVCSFSQIPFSGVNHSMAPSTPLPDSLKANYKVTRGFPQMVTPD